MEMAEKWVNEMIENNNTAVKISVLMSVYNAEKTLCAAIDSILNQTFTDFEFIMYQFFEYQMAQAYSWTTNLFQITDVAFAQQ